MRAESRVFLDLQGAYWSQYKTCNESSLGTVDGVPEIWDGLGLADPALGTIGRICLFFGSYGSRHCFGVFWISDSTIRPKRIGFLAGDVCAVSLDLASLASLTGLAGLVELSFWGW